MVITVKFKSALHLVEPTEVIVVTTSSVSSAKHVQMLCFMNWKGQWAESDAHQWGYHPYDSTSWSKKKKEQEDRKYFLF